MVKVRVYELAKDLNMTNRALLNKMKELKIEVKSHMSSLENSDIMSIKKSLSGKKKEKNDVQVKPSVIRRRKHSHEEDFDNDESADDRAVNIIEEVPDKIESVQTESAQAEEVPTVPTQEVLDERSDELETELTSEPETAPLETAAIQQIGRASCRERV